MFAHGLVLLKVSQRQGQGEMRRVMFGPVMQSLLVGLDRIGISLRRKNQAEVVSGPFCFSKKNSEKALLKWLERDKLGDLSIWGTGFCPPGGG